MSDAALDDTNFDMALVTAALALAAESGWAAVSSHAAAVHANVPVERARTRFPSRASILRKLGELADAAALASATDEGSVRDRLFDLLMRRIDLFQAHRPGVLALLRALPTEPTTALFLACATERSMAWMLQAAGVSANGLRGKLRVKGLTGVWLWIFRVWERDDSEDLSATMAALDQVLARVEPFARFLAEPNAPPAVPPIVDQVPPVTP